MNGLMHGPIHMNGPSLHFCGILHAYPMTAAWSSGNSTRAMPVPGCLLLPAGFIQKTASDLHSSAASRKNS